MSLETQQNHKKNIYIFTVPLKSMLPAVALPKKGMNTTVRTAYVTHCRYETSPWLVCLVFMTKFHIEGLILYVHMFLT